MEEGALRPIKVELAQRKKSFHALKIALMRALLSGKIGQGMSSAKRQSGSNGSATMTRELLRSVELVTQDCLQ